MARTAKDWAIECARLELLLRGLIKALRSSEAFPLPELLAAESHLGITAVGEVKP